MKMQKEDIRWWNITNCGLKNNKSQENPKQCDNLQDRNADKKQPKETNNNSLWPSVLVLLWGIPW